tara:strand:- start:486 stop:1187 length:702 start_codon:yes stop_codon:yes gene_type:complete
MDVYIKKERIDQIQHDMKNAPEEFSAFVNVIDILPFDKNFCVLVLEKGYVVSNINYNDLQDLISRFFGNINNKCIIYEDFKMDNIIMSLDNKLKITDLCGLQYQNDWKALGENGSTFSSWSLSKPGLRTSLTLAIQTMYFSIIITMNIKRENAYIFAYNYEWDLKNTNSDGLTMKILDICENVNNNLACLLKLLINKDYIKVQLNLLNQYKKNAHLTCNEKKMYYIPSKQNTF